MSHASKDDENQFMYDLPRANVNRIIKKALPEGVVVVKESKTAFSKAAVVFIMYLTATSQEHAQKHKRSTLMADDVLAAIEELDLHRYKDKLVETLHMYRASQAAKNQAKMKRKTKKQEQTSDNTASPVPALPQQQ